MGGRDGTTLSGVGKRRDRARMRMAARVLHASALHCLPGLLESSAVCALFTCPREFLRGAGVRRGQRAMGLRVVLRTG